MVAKERKGGLGLVAKQVRRATEGMGGDPSRQEAKLLRLALDRIVPDPNQARRVFDEEAMTELAASIAQNGLLQPPILAETSERGTYRIVAGERRWRAVKQLGWSEMDVIVVEQGTRAAGLVENMQRRDLTPLEEANAIAALGREEGWGDNLAAIAKVLGKPLSTVSESLGLLRLAPELQEDPTIGSTSRSVLVELSRLPVSQQVAMWRRAVDRGVPLTTQEIRAFKEGRETQPRPAAPAVGARPLRRKGWEAILARVEGHMVSGGSLGPKERDAAQRLYGKLKELLER